MTRRLLIAIVGGVQLCATAGLKYEVLTESPIHVVYDREAPVVVSLTSDETRLLKGTLFAEDYFGNQVGTTVDCKVVSNETVCVRLPPMKRYGAYIVKSDLEGSRKDVTRFAVLPAREWTQPLAEGKFAMGTQEQLPWYTAEDQAKVIESARMMGSKVVRLNFCSFPRVCKNSPEPDWTEADRYMRILETKGMRIDANIYGFPQWAQKKPGMAAPVDGTFETFCRQLAERYGTKITWYEIGNEWDLQSPVKFPTEEAIRIQKEAWRGLKAGNPDVKVIPNGWAYVSTPESKTARVNDPKEWIHERVLSEAKGFYDYHAVHIHMEYEGYVGQLQKLFKWRKERGVTAPWFPNETAQSCVFGRERIVARNVWRKILYSWAHGAVSYSWYQMRAVNDDPNSAIGGYGLMTPDFHPRYTYAAYAALTRLLTNADFEKAYADTLMRQVLGFDIVRLGEREKIVVGWDALIQDDSQPMAVAVSSDAKSVYAYDLNGNAERIAPGADGRYSLYLSSTPRALVFREATRVEIAPEEALKDLRDDTIPERPFIVATPMKFSTDGVHKLAAAFEHEAGFVVNLHLEGATLKELKLNGRVVNDLSDARHGTNELELTVEGREVTIEIEEARKVSCATPQAFTEIISKQGREQE